MSFLGLDLDETLIVVEQRRELIHPDTVLSPERGFYEVQGSAPICFRIINPTKIARLITKAITENDGVFIITSGNWDRKILLNIVLLLDLDPEVEAKFLACKFYSAVTNTKYFKFADGSEVDSDTVANEIDKHTQLQKIFASDPDYNGKGTVLVENSENQVESCADSPRVDAVLANTETSANPDYCDVAAEKLDQMQAAEEIFALSRLQELQRLKEIQEREAERQKQEFVENLDELMCKETLENEGTSGAQNKKRQRRAPLEEITNSNLRENSVFAPPKSTRRKVSNVRDKENSAPGVMI